MTECKDITVYYIHGFNSSVNSDTLKQLRQHFPDAIGLTYDHTDPVDSLIQLVETIENTTQGYPIIVGSSLGGWYTEQLTGMVVADFILYNPCIDPYHSLGKYGVPFDVLNKYRDFSPFLSPASRSVILSCDDPVIAPSNTHIKYRDIAPISYTSGGHRMTDDAMKMIVEKIRYLENQMPL